MIYTELPLGGAYQIDIAGVRDERGFFGRSWCQREFAERGLDPSLAQCNVSYNTRRGTLRGLHYQAEPHQEAKLVRCTRGRVYDVLVDLRPASPTIGQWAAVELTADNWRMVYVPKGVAHGFQTLEDDSELFYQMSESYYPELTRGVRWDDPTFSIKWPIPEPIMSDRDRVFPYFAR